MQADTCMPRQCTRAGSCMRQLAHQLETLSCRRDLWSGEEAGVDKLRTNWNLALLTVRAASRPLGCCRRGSQSPICTKLVYPL